jgi:hypothetical protein
MRFRGLTNLLGFAGLLLGLLMLVKGGASGADGFACQMTCVNRAYFIDGSGGNCIASEVRDCFYCAKSPLPCQCHAPFYNTDSCTYQNLKILVTTYGVGVCDTPCSYVLGPGYTEATSPSGPGSSGQYGWFWCPE